ncbi:MAG: MATE family efflux transporter [Lachnospiraceae bacterium]|nr:MATE family efflux transporter [Lachnospiraceae bacterium]
MNSKENKMGTMPVNKLLISMALPMMVSMLVQALYNIVDSMFVSYISEDALTAVSLAFPIQQLMIAMGTGTGVGVNAVLSKALGEKDFEKANRAADNGIFLSVVCAVIFVFIGLFFVDPFYMSQTTDAEILQAGHDYLSVVCCFGIGMYTQIICERLLQATGRTVLSMLSQGLGAVINIVLDPILIFGLLGFPAMGVKGAAVATVIGQIISAAVGIWMNISKNHDIKISFRGFCPDLKMIGTIYKVGVPSIIMQAVGSVMNYGMNQILIGFTSTATAVFGAYYKLQSFIFMPVFGLNNGMIPIIAYNYGAGQRKRVLQTIRSSVILAVGIMLVGLAAMQIFPAQLLSIFNASEHMLAIGVPALRLISLSFVFAGYCIVMGSVFQALGNGVYSMLTSIVRQMAVLLPVAFLLSLSGNVNLVWLSFPIAELFSVTLSTVFLFKINKTVISQIGISGQ